MTDEFNNLLEEDLASRSLSVGQIIEGTVVQISEDGVFVDIGAKSEGHLELDQIFQEELAKLNVGNQLKVRIIKKVNGEFKLSKKSVDFELAWNRLLEDKEAGNDVEITVTEKVKNGYMCTAYGVLDGFIHHTNFKGKPEIGKEYKAQVLDLNRKARKLVFSRRDVLKREREEALERDYGVLQEGMVIEGVVEKLSPYGAFVKITDNLTGLLHISEFSHEHVKKPSEVLKAGDVVQVKILTIDKENNKISLSRKAALKDPLMLMLPGEELDGKVESLADFGLFVKLENGVTGLVHISEISHRKFNHPSELYKPNDAIRVKVLRVNVDDRRVSLSAKSCERDPWSEVYSRFSVGQSVEGEVTQILQSGVVMKLDDFFEAFVPISEISEDRIKHPSDLIAEGENKSGVILSIDSGKRRIRVSLRRTAEDIAEEQSKVPEGRPVKSVEQPTDTAATAGKVTLGDILGGKLDLTSVGKKDESDDEQPAAEAETETVEEEEAPAAGAEAEVEAEIAEAEEESEATEETPAEETSAEDDAPEPAVEEEAEEETEDEPEAEEAAAEAEATEAEAMEDPDDASEAEGEAEEDKAKKD